MFFLHLDENIQKLYIVAIDSLVNQNRDYFNFGSTNIVLSTGGQLDRHPLPCSGVEHIPHGQLLQLQRKS